MPMQIPDRIARLPKDHRGYPIPWNVLRGKNNHPIFTVNDDRKTLRGITEHRCPICGEIMGRWHWFVGGPLSAFHEHGWYVDLPMHHECMQFALATCPYLALPNYLKRIDVPDPSKLPPEAFMLADETQIPERPEVFVAVASNRVEVNAQALGLPHVRPMRPLLGYEFWRYGKQITTDEALPMLRTALGAEWQLPEVES